MKTPWLQTTHRSKRSPASLDQRQPDDVFYRVQAILAGRVVHDRAALRPAIVRADAGRSDLVLCQVTSRRYGDER